MPRKGVTRGDLIVAAAAVGVLVFSFLPWYKATAEGNGAVGFHSTTDTYTAWVTDFWPLAPAVVVLSSISLVLLLAGRYTIRRPGTPQAAEVQVCGLSPRQWGVALGVAAAWSAVWSAFGADGGYDKLAEVAEETLRRSYGSGENGTVEAGHSYGAWGVVGFAVLQALLLLIGDRPAFLAKPLGRSAPRPNTWPGYPGGGFPGAPGGFPPPPGTGGFVAAPGYIPGNTPPPQHPPVIQPPVVQPPVVTPPAAVPGTPSGGSAPTDPGTFEQYWLAVPEPRPLFPVEGEGDPVATLHSGIWYLAVGARNGGVVIDIDGLQGVLMELTDIQRGE